MKKYLRLEPFFLLICLMSNVVLADDLQEKIDLKKKQLIEIKNGKLYSIDWYSFKPIDIATSPKLVFQIRQDRSISNTQDCGKLFARTIYITGAGDENVQMDSSEFDEFVGAKDYLKSFTDAWDTLDKDKTKGIYYNFGKLENAQKGTDAQFSGQLHAFGDRDGLRFEIVNKGSSKVVFATSDLKVINQFNVGVNDLQKFLKAHRFEECL